MFEPGTVIEIDEYMSPFELALGGCAAKSMDTTKVTVCYKVLQASRLWYFFNRGKVRLSPQSIKPDYCMALIPLSVLPAKYIEAKMKIGTARIVTGETP